MKKDISYKMLFLLPLFVLVQWKKSQMEPKCEVLISPVIELSLSSTERLLLE